MVSTLAWETTFSTWLSTFLAMSVLSFGFFLVLFLKSRAVKKIPTTLTVTIFSKTFNVFDPSPEHRRMFQSDFFFILTGLWAVMLVLLAFVEILLTGLIIEFSISILCLGLMMIAEATETYSIANTLLKAVEKHTSFGQGDIYLLTIVKKTIGKLSAYYIFLSAVFVALFFTMPYMLPSLIFVFSQFVRLITSASFGVPFIGPFIAALLFALFIIVGFRIAGRVKCAFFGFLPSDIFETDEINATWIYHGHA